MKIEVYEQSKERDPTLRLKLVRLTNGIVVVSAVNENGEQIPSGWLLSIRPDGTFKRCSHVAPSLGLSRDAKGRIIEADG